MLVEVKRSTDTRIRREVVGQMLDYASRMRAWSASELRASAPLLDVPDDLWAALDGNLKAERMRLIFAADSIPDSLASMIDFLDRSMDSIEVCGVEIKQYVSEDGAELISSTIVGGGNSPVKQAARYSTIGTPTAWPSNSVSVGAQLSFRLSPLSHRSPPVPDCRSVMVAVRSLACAGRFGTVARYLV